MKGLLGLWRCWKATAFFETLLGVLPLVVAPWKAFIKLTSSLLLNYEPIKDNYQCTRGERALELQFQQAFVL